jgi:hypothetical protein
VPFRDRNGFVRRICLVGLFRADDGVVRLQILDAVRDVVRAMIVVLRALRDTSHITFIGDMSRKT